MFSDPTYWAKIITVNNMVALNDALDSEYGAVIAVCDAARGIKDSIKKYVDSRELSKISNAVFFLTPLNPLFFISLGLFGKFMSSNKVNKYNVDINGSERIILIHKKALFTESQRQELEAVR